MPIFDPHPDEPEFDGDDEAWQAEARDRVIGGIVAVRPILASNGRAAVVCSHITVDPYGISFSIVATRRQLRQARDGFDDPFTGLRIGVQLGDGTQLEVNDRWCSDDTGDPGFSLHTDGSSSNETTWDGRHRLEPLPAGGALTFACIWDEVGIAESTATIGPLLIAEALAQAVRLWPEDDDVVEPPGGAATSYAP